MSLPLSNVTERKTMGKPYHRVKLISKADGHLGREEPVGIVEKLLTIPKLLLKAHVHFKTKNLPNKWSSTHASSFPKERMNKRTNYT